MTPHDFLRVLVDAFAERLQAGSPVALPGIGAWKLADVEAVSPTVEFSSERSGAMDEAILELAHAVGKRSGHDVAAAASGLRRFSRSVILVLEQDGHLDLPGIGILESAEDGVRFTPSTELLSALTLHATSGDPAGARTAPEPRTAPHDAGDRDAPSSGPIESRAEGAPPVGKGVGESEPADPSPEDGAVPVDGATEDPSSEPAGGAASGFEAAPEARPEPSETTSPTSTSVADKPPKARAARAASRDRDGRRGLIVVAGLVVVAVVVAALLYMNPSEPPPENQARLSPPADIADTAFSRDSVMTTGQDSVDLASVPPSAAEPVPDPSREVPAPAPTETVPDRGAFDETTSGYTLIASSTPEDGVARRVAEALGDLGHPVSVLSYEENGSTRYRVGVGIFTSVAVADSIRRALSDRLPEGTWVRRIRP